MGSRCPYVRMLRAPNGRAGVTALRRRQAPVHGGWPQQGKTRSARRRRRVGSPALGPWHSPATGQDDAGSHPGNGQANQKPHAAARAESHSGRQQERHPAGSEREPQRS